MSDKILVRGKNIYKNHKINYLVLFFLIHGFLFFLRPEEIYDLGSPIRYIKYIIIVLSYIFVLKNCSPKKVFIYVLIIITMCAINIVAVSQNFSVMTNISYLLPLGVFFFYEGLSKNLNLKKIVKWTYLIATFFGYFEFFILGGVFYRFASSGYRVISIFVNPNNFALMIAVLSIYIISNQQNKMSALGVLINSIILILLSGSKTGLFVFLIVVSIHLAIIIMRLFYYKSKINKTVFLYILVLGFSMVCISIVFLFFNNNSLNLLINQTRSFDTMIVSLDSRFMQYSNFIFRSNFFFPWNNVVNYVDNIYLHIWGTFGFPVMLFYILFNLYLLYRSIQKGVFIYFGLLILFLISGLTTNVLYLWPLGYIYWYLAGSILQRNKHAIAREV